MLPCLIFEDEHLLVVNKPAGVNTHAPSPDAAEGIYDWLRHREPRWASLAIIHRLDKETSGVLAFSRTPVANRSLTAQFEQRTVQKKYLLLTDRAAPRREITVKSSLVRAGEKYASRPALPGADLAETRFIPVAAKPETFRDRSAAAAGSQCRMIEAQPRTGRTHQIRVHAADSGFPILGDELYGGSPAPRIFLHAAELILKHPSGGGEMVFYAPLDFKTDARLSLRAALIDGGLTNAWRVIHGAGDDRPGWYVERYEDYLLSQCERSLTSEQTLELRNLATALSARGTSHSIVPRSAAHPGPARSLPEQIAGVSPPERFNIRENGLEFEISFSAGKSPGLFLDQRDNRRRCLTGHVAAGFALFANAKSPEPGAMVLPGSGAELLNTFAYTCGFSVCAAKAGARTTSLDLSKAHLEWGRRNLLLNQLNPALHEFIHGDVFDWIRRLGRKQRLFDVILLDPPTFSRSKASGVFRVERDMGHLVQSAVRLLKPAGTLFVSTNAAEWRPEAFRQAVEAAVRHAKRTVLRRHYVPQPADFPIRREEPAYLKTLWLQVA